MSIPFSLTAALRLTIALIVILGCAALLSSSDTPAYKDSQKAFYADANLASFVRPGFQIKVFSASIDADGTIKTRFKITDPKGLPLDREGIITPGAVSLSIVAAHIPKGQTQYVAYTTRTQTSPITSKSAIQASSDSGGRYEKVADGEYVYALATKAPANFDKTATHAIGIWGGRDLAEFDLASIFNYDDDVFTWVPDGSKVTVTRDVIKTATCNKCHDVLSLHNNRRSMELCVLCHTPQTIDPDTGNTVDMPVMTHKIHMGVNLPSVKAGRKYEIIGHNQSRHDYSTVLIPSDARDCVVCHEQNTGAAQASAYLTPNRAACGACHDDVNFASGENHADLPQVSDNQCATCHVPRGELELDASIKGAHTIPRLAGSLPGVVFEILKVENGLAGQRPSVTFTLKDKSGKPILPSQMSNLTLVLAGPASDYATTTDLLEDARQAKCGSDGTCTWTLQTAIPDDAKGTHSIGIHGFREVKLLPGTKKEQTVRNNGTNRVVHFSVDGSPVQPRRAVVSTEKCNACHASLLVHSRFKPSDRIEQCVLCHLPSFTDKDAAFKPPDVMPQPLSFRVMIHKIHTGEELTREYATYGTTSVHKFNGIRYSGDRRNCEACHVGGSEQLPLKEGLLPVADPQGFMNPTQPATAACLSCHDGVAAASHALSNTTEKLGEACAACHGTNYKFAVRRVHAR